MFESKHKCITIGIPIPIVAISAGVSHGQYGHDDLWVQYSTFFMNLYPTIVQSCWIDTEKGAIWGFVAPMLGIIIVSFVSAAL